jgi:hypothetical protein
MNIRSQSLLSKAQIQGLNDYRHRPGDDRETAELKPLKRGNF